MLHREGRIRQLKAFTESLSSGIAAPLVRHFEDYSDASVQTEMMRMSLFQCRQMLSDANIIGKPPQKMGPSELERLFVAVAGKAGRCVRFGQFIEVLLGCLPAEANPDPKAYLAAKFFPALENCGRHALSASYVSFGPPKVQPSAQESHENAREMLQEQVWHLEQEQALCTTSALTFFLYRLYL